MNTTTHNIFCHFFIIVLNSSLILNQMDVVIDDRYFELKFVVEQDTLVNVPVQIDMDDNG